MLKFIHIGGDSRSGGSLIPRLFDGMPNVGAFFFENEYFRDRNGTLINFDRYRTSGELADIEAEEVVAKIKSVMTEE